MKKLISLSAAVLITAIAFAQDSIPTPEKKKNDTINIPKKQSFPDSTKLDTTQKVSNLNSDTLNTANQLPKNTPPTVMSKDTMPSASGTASSGKVTATNNSQTDSTDQAKKMIADRVIMMNDQVMIVKNGDSTLLADSVKLKSGALVMKDGSVTYTNGTTTKLKNGQYVNLIPAETEQADSNSQTDSASKATALVDDKVVMKDDKVIVVKNGDSTLLEDSIKLKSGAIVKKDATVKFKDGTKTKLKNGQYIALNPAPAAESKKSKKINPKKKEKEEK